MHYYKNDRVEKMWVLLEVKCAPHPADASPVPTTIDIVKLFGSEEEAMAWLVEPGDVIHRPDQEFQGQEVYQLVWNLDEPLNLDRSIDNSREVYEVGEWLPSEKRILADTIIKDWEILPPEKVAERAEKRKALYQKKLREAGKNGQGQVYDDNGVLLTGEEVRRGFKGAKGMPYMGNLRPIGGGASWRHF